MNKYTNLEICKSLDKLEVASNIQVAVGTICRCSTINFYGVGHAICILRNDKIAEIHYNYKIINIPSGRTFVWGLSAQALHELNNNIPLITPLEGVNGICEFFTSSGRHTKNEYGAGTMKQEYYWEPYRLYYKNDSYNIGIWATNDGWSDVTVDGVAFGTY